MSHRLPLIAAVAVAVLGLGGCQTSPRATPLAEPSLAVRAGAEQVEAALGTLFDQMRWSMVRDDGEGLPAGQSRYRGRSAQGQAVTVRTSRVGAQTQVRIDIGAVTGEPRRAAVDRLRELFVRQGAKLEEPIEVRQADPLMTLGGE